MRNPLSKKRIDLSERLVALEELAGAAAGRIPSEDERAITELVQRSSDRLRLGSDLTVVALAGATGSGKSSLFNTLTGSELSQVGVKRPTTGVTHAAVWSEERDATELLTLLQVQRRHHLIDADLEGLILLDLPDHDSTQVEHRLEVNRLAEIVDIFMWVLDPQKYADAALHEGYLRPLARYAEVTIVVLNQIDLLTPEERQRCEADVGRLLIEDGLKKVTLLGTSTRTGEGIPELRALIAQRVAAERAAVARASADLETLGARLENLCKGSVGSELSRREGGELVSALSDAAGVRHVSQAVAAAHRRDASLNMGWPFTRWLRRLRPDPLARLHLRNRSTGGKTSLPAPTQIQRAGVENAIRRAARSAEGDHGAPWSRSLQTVAEQNIPQLETELDKAIARADLGVEKKPRWWSWVNGVQTILATLAIVGFAWLALLFALGWFQIPEPPTPEVRQIPWPTLLLFGGLLAGFLLSVITARLAAVGAARRKRKADQTLTAQVSAVASRLVQAPIEEELEQRMAFCDALQRLNP